MEKEKLMSFSEIYKYLNFLKLLLRHLEKFNSANKKKSKNL